MKEHDVASAIDPHLPLSITEELIRIPSYQAGEMEANLIAYIKGRFEKRDIPYRVIQRDGVDIGIIGKIGEGPRSLMFHSHIDTVPPANIEQWDNDPFTPVQSGGKLYGLGACDDKGSLGAMLAAFETLAERRSELGGTLIMAAVGAEERGGLGTQTLVAEEERAEAVVLGEPTMAEPKIGHKGVLRLEIITNGVSAHASTPKEGVNAISHMAALIPGLDELAEKVALKTEQYTGQASMAVTTIQGGTALNVIPSSCSISIDRRLVPGEGEHEATEAVHRVIRECKKRIPELNTEVKRVRCVPAALTEPESPIVSMALEIAGDELEKRLGPAGFSACCDMAYLKQAGMPVVILGPGDVGMAHKMNEYVDIASLSAAANIYARIASRWSAGK